MAEHAGGKRPVWREIGGKQTSGAKAHFDSVGFLAGDESPAYPIPSFSAACEGPFLLLALAA